MAAFATEKALLLIDFINEIVDPKGKSAGKGYTDFDARHGSLDRVSSLLNHARNNGFAVIHVGVGFSPEQLRRMIIRPLAEIITAETLPDQTEKAQIFIIRALQLR